MQPAVKHGVPHLKRIHGFAPATFVERGVVVPFTTPALVGARLRPGRRREPELIVRNPSGGPGVYIVGWDGVHGLCCPTLHDRRLNARLATLEAMTPAAVRRVACDIAAQGFAGRDAMAAAKELSRRIEQDRQFAAAELLLETARVVHERAGDWTPRELADTGALQRGAGAVLAKLAGQIGRTGDDVMARLQELAVVFAGIGVGRQAAAARIPAMIARLDAFREDVRRWQGTAADGRGCGAEQVDRAAELTASLARRTWQAASGLLGNLPGLLMLWNSSPDQIRRVAGRPEWLLDGWERIWLLWQTADEGFGFRETLRDIAALIPAMPREVTGWTEENLDARLEALARDRHASATEGRGPEPAQADLIARNERLRAMAPAGPA